MAAWGLGAATLEDVKGRSSTWGFAYTLAVVALLGPVQAVARPHVVVVSLDTTRADALSCYGTPPEVRRSAPRTPNLDALAEGGVRFENAFAHAPTTLNSHTTVFSGLDPHGHGVPRNGFPVPEDVPLLAEVLREAGYETIGVIGAAALEGAMGLTRGFQTYDDTVGGKQGRMFQDRADSVLQRTLRALSTRDRTRPLFLFVHFYDAHWPYDAPGGWRDRWVDPEYRGSLRGQSLRRPSLVKRLVSGTLSPDDRDYVASRYLSEVSYVDHHVGRLLEHLRDEGILEEAIVVVVADHGEVLSELPGLAYSHGADVSEGSMRVPLIVSGAGVPRRVVQREVGLDGIAPMLERLVGLEPSLGDRWGLWEHVRPGPVWDEDGWPERPTRTVFQEATRPHSREPSTGWNNRLFQRAVRAGGSVLSHAPLAGEWSGGAPAMRPLLRRYLAAWDAGAPPRVEEELSDDTRHALEALGYLGSEP